MILVILFEFKWFILSFFMIRISCWSQLPRSGKKIYLSFTWDLFLVSIFSRSHFDSLQSHNRIIRITFSRSSVFWPILFWVQDFQVIASPDHRVDVVLLMIKIKTPVVTSSGDSINKIKLKLQILLWITPGGSMIWKVSINT